MAEQSQSFESHAKLVPAFHYFTLPVLLGNLLWQVYGAVVGFSVAAVGSVLVAAALMTAAVFARVFALGAQDRVIRLEERLRLGDLAPDLKPRLDELTIEQVVGLRFASDAEAPALARKVLHEKLADRKAIKQMVQTWRPDDARL